MFKKTPEWFLMFFLSGAKVGVWRELPNFFGALIDQP